MLYEKEQIFNEYKKSLHLSFLIINTNLNSKREVKGQGGENLDQSRQLVVYFTTNKGYVVSQEETSKLNGTVEVTGQNMTFPVVMNITVKLQLK